MKLKGEIKWQTHKLEDVIRFFTEGFDLKEGETINRYEWYLDTAKGEVVFCLHKSRLYDDE